MPKRGRVTRKKQEPDRVFAAGVWLPVPPERPVLGAARPWSTGQEAPRRTRLARANADRDGEKDDWGQRSPPVLGRNGGKTPKSGDLCVGQVEQRALAHARQFLYRFFRSQLHSPGARFEYADDPQATADDLCQEALADIWRQLSHYVPRDGTSFDDWVARFAWTHWHRYCERGLGGLSRERKRRRPVEVYPSTPYEEEVDEALENLAFAASSDRAVSKSSRTRPPDQQPEADGWECDECPDEDPLDEFPRRFDERD